MKKSISHFLFTLFTAVLVTIVAVGTSRAQADSTQGHHHHGGMMMTSEHMMEQHIHMMKTKLGLSDAQVDQLKSMMQQHMTKMKADMEAVKNAPKGSDARKDARKQLTDDRKAMMNMDDMKSILTPEQYKKFKAMRLMQIDKAEKRMEARKKELQK
jgi:Spy/CpxP family protein refolding chaperone